jgi:hypothetical protein
MHKNFKEKGVMHLPTPSIERIPSTADNPAPGTSLVLD